MAKTSMVQLSVKFNLWVFDLSIPFIFLTVLFLISPMIEEPNSINLGDHGKVGVPDNFSKISNLKYHASRLTYTLGDVICHQRASRSLFINGNQMPVCSRCFAIFLSFGLSLLLLSFIKLKLPPYVYLATLLPLFVDGTLQLLTTYESTNLVRIVSGCLAGFGSAYLLAESIRSQSD